MSCGYTCAAAGIVRHCYARPVGNIPVELAILHSTLLLLKLLVFLF